MCKEGGKMTEQEYHDLLIRMDTRQGAMEEDLKEIKKVLSKRMCHTHAEKIRTLEKITWGAVMLSIGAVMKSFWSVITGP